jgi:hypothetical protein
MVFEINTGTYEKIKADSIVEELTMRMVEI